MAANLFKIGRYFKKDDSPKNQSSAAGSQTGTTTTSQTVQTTEATTTGAHAPYNGIGTPPPPKSETVTKTTQVTQQDRSGHEGKQDGQQDQSASTLSSVDEVHDVGAIDMKKRSNMDILTRLTQRSTGALMQGVNKAKELGARFVDTEHVLWGLLSDAQIYQLVSELKADPKAIQDELTKNFRRDTSREQPQFSPRVKHVLEMAHSAARAMKYEFISPEHILLALSQEGEGMAAQILVKFNLTSEALNKKVSGKKDLLGSEKDKEGKTGGGGIQEFCEDLTIKAREGKLDPVVGRSAEIERTIHILSRRTKNNPVLIGDAGVGKTAIVEGLAQKIASGDVPETLREKHILQLDLMSLIAGARHRGEFEERLKNLIKEVKGASGQYVLFIDEIHNMVGAGAGGEGTMDASNILKPSLARGELQTIGTTTVTEYRKYMEKDPALERRFQPILVNEPSEDQAIEMLMALKDKYEAFHKVSIPDEVVEAAVRLSKRYVGDRFLPDKAVDLMDEAGAAVRLPAISLPEEIRSLEKKIGRLQNEHKEATKIRDGVRVVSLEKELIETNDELTEKKQSFEKKKATTTNIVTTETVQEIVSRWTNIPISKLTEKETDKLVKLEDLIHKRIIDQERAVTAVSEAVRRGRAGLKSSKRPIGSFVFMGPTGVGKTELAKAIAEILFGAEELMVRLDMTEYMERHEAAKMIGAPPGYVGYEEGGQLTEAVRRHPYSVVLFDEIEKAHPDVFNILIQLLDDGRLTDNKGRTISFKNTIVICTSNIGTELIQRNMVADEEKSKGANLINMGALVSGVTLDKKDMDLEQLAKLSGVNKETVEKALGELYLSYVTLQPTVIKELENARELIESISAQTGTEERVVESVLKEVGESTPPLSINNVAQKLKMAEEVVNQVLSGISKELIKTDFSLVYSSVTKNLAEKQISEVLLKIGLTDEDIEKLQQSFRAQTTPSGVKQVLTTGKLAEEIKIPEEKVREILAMLFETAVILQPQLVKDISGKKELITKVPSSGALGADTVVSFYTAVGKQTGELSIGDLAKSLKLTEDAIHQMFKETAPLLLESESEMLKKILNTVAVGEVYEEVAKHLEIEAKTVGELVKYVLDYSADSHDSKEGKKVKDTLDEGKFAQMSEMLMGELRKFFRPELLNRFDELIVFRPLTEEHMNKIVDLQINGLVKLLVDQSLALQVSPKAKEALAKLGYDPIFGARPLRRTIQRQIENPVSNLIIRGETKVGDTIKVDYDGDKFIFNVEHVKVEEAIDESKPAEGMGEPVKAEETKGIVAEEQKKDESIITEDKSGSNVQAAASTDGTKMANGHVATAGSPLAGFFGE